MRQKSCARSCVSFGVLAQEPPLGAGLSSELHAFFFTEFVEHSLDTASRVGGQNLLELGDRCARRGAGSEVFDDEFLVGFIIARADLNSSRVPSGSERNFSNCSGEVTGIVIYIP